MFVINFNFGDAWWILCLGLVNLWDPEYTLSIITGRLQAWLQVKTLHFSYTGTLLKFYRQVLLVLMVIHLKSTALAYKISVPVYEKCKVFTCSYACNLHVIIDSECTVHVTLPKLRISLKTV